MSDLKLVGLFFAAAAMVDVGSAKPGTKPAWDAFNAAVAATSGRQVQNEVKSDTPGAPAALKQDKQGANAPQGAVSQQDLDDLASRIADKQSPTTVVSGHGGGFFSWPVKAGLGLLVAAVMYGLHNKYGLLSPLVDQFSKFKQAIGGASRAGAVTGGTKGK
ncbi:MAG: hypothetical protein LBF84_01325 [Holosporales bacterium]|nr:hypothetical protein [Holosporales bacterium]